MANKEVIAKEIDIRYSVINEAKNLLNRYSKSKRWRFFHY